MSAARSESPREIPEVGTLELLWRMLRAPNQRVDMRAGLLQLMADYGPVVQQRAGPMKVVNLLSPEGNRFVLLDTERVFSARQPWMMIMGRIFPNGLLLQDGDIHKHHRRIMHMPFKRPALRVYAERMGPMIERTFDAWAGEREILAFPRFKELTLEMAASIFVGVESGADTREMNRAFEDMVAASMSRIRLPIPGLEFQRGLAGRRFMQRFLGDLIGKRRASDGPDLFTRLCHAETEEGQRFADEEILDHMIFLMMAAHDTTTSTLCSIAYLLARHPEWQERVRAECRAVGAQHLDFDRMGELESLTLAFYETLRLYPPLPVIPRTATREARFEGWRIPGGSMVVVAPIVTHTLPEWWDDPLRFDPERFAPGRAEHERHSHLWIPFGGGPHMCLGKRFAELQVKTVLHQLLQRFRLSVDEGYEMPIQQAPISKPRDGLPLRVEAL